MLWVSSSGVGWRSLRFLPLDVRVSDVPGFASLREERAGEGDHRTFEALHGVTHGNLAMAKVEGLLSLAPGANGWVLAHEFAHLVLARRYGLDVEQQWDDRGVSADVFTLFEELEHPV